MESSIGYKLGQVALVFCCILAFQAIAFSQANRISGQVYGVDRRPLSEVYVELISDTNSVLQRAKTTGSGAYTFAGMAAGRYTVRVRPFATDYEEQTQEVEIVTAVGGGRTVYDSQYKDFYLRPRRDANKQPSVTGVVFAQDIPDAASKAYEKAIVDLDASRTDAGISGLESAVYIFPDYFLALDRLGVELIKKQKFSEARKHFEKAVVVNTRAYSSWYGLAFTLLAQNFTKEAIDAAKKAVVLAPDSPDFYLLLGIALRKDKDYPEAEKSLLKAKNLSKGTLADASWNLALLYVYNIKNNRLAADELENYLKINPAHPDAVQLRKFINDLRNKA